MLDKEQAKAIFEATNQNSGSFDIFYKILAEVYSSMSNLEELIGQIMYIMNSAGQILFYPQSGSLYEYKPLKESKEALKLVYNITKQIESLLDTKYLFPLASNSDQPIQEICEKLTKADELVLKTKARALAQGMVYLQDDKDIQAEFNKKLAEGTSDIVNSKALKITSQQIFEFKEELDKWKKEQLRILEDKLIKMVPTHSYFFAYGGGKVKKISSQTGKQQAKELAKEIVELIYKKRLKIFERFRKQPWGGQIGNMFGGWGGVKGEMECADWTALFYQGLEDNLKQYYKRNLNSFRIEWRRIAPWLYDHFEHNYIRILGPDKSRYLVIDPWRSGGRKIVPEKEKTSLWPWQGNYLYNEKDNIYAYPKEDKF